jgi:diadenosine tetraphosphatase ApaH/serine/threonine PP2A family protein phosphatase
VVLCHGSPVDEDAYVFSDYDAYEIFGSHPAQVTFFGHTHVPSLFVQHERGIDVALLRGETGTIEIQDGRRYLINPGSIGQPRDRDPRAAYMTYDTARRVVHWHRLDYPVDKARGRITAAGLPKVLGDRLAIGA